jgi:hypothetical protein
VVDSAEAKTAWQSRAWRRGLKHSVRVHSVRVLSYVFCILNPDTLTLCLALSYRYI